MVLSACLKQTLHLDAEQEVADAEQELANWQTAKNSQTIAALDLPSLPQRLSLNHGLVVDSERIVLHSTSRASAKRGRMLTESGSGPPRCIDRNVVHCSDFDCHSKTQLLCPGASSPRRVWELVDAGRAPTPLRRCSRWTI